MQQRQPRLGDILDDYCPRERRLTNHVVVAMIGEMVKQTRCTTCESDHEYKHATVPRPRKKSEQSTLYSQVLANVSPKKITPTPTSATDVAVGSEAPPAVAAFAAPPPQAHIPTSSDFDALFDLPADEDPDGNRDEPVEDGPAHRRLIRAQLPRHEGQVATTRQAPDFTIRQPNPGRPKRFGGGRPDRGGLSSQGNRPGGGAGNANGNARGGGPRPSGRHNAGARPAQRPGGGRRPK
jgi:hypothetical protein